MMNLECADDTSVLLEQIDELSVIGNLNTSTQFRRRKTAQRQILAKRID